MGVCNFDGERRDYMTLDLKSLRVSRQTILRHISKEELEEQRSLKEWENRHSGKPRQLPKKARRLPTDKLPSKKIFLPMKESLFFSFKFSKVFVTYDKGRMKEILIPAGQYEVMRIVSPFGDKKSWIILKKYYYGGENLQRQFVGLQEQTLKRCLDHPDPQIRIATSTEADPIPPLRWR